MASKPDFYVYASFPIKNPLKNGLNAFTASGIYSFAFFSNKSNCNSKSLALLISINAIPLLSSSFTKYVYVANGSLSYKAYALPTGESLIPTRPFP